MVRDYSSPDRKTFFLKITNAGGRISAVQRDFCFRGGA